MRVMQAIGASPPARSIKSPSALQCRMDVKTTRRQRLEELERQFHSLAALERATNGEVTASYLSQVKNGYRQMGDRIARKLEQGLGKKFGWMDQNPVSTVNIDPGTEYLSLPPILGRTAHVSGPGGAGVLNDRTTITIPVLALEGAMGSGRAQPEYETVVGGLNVSRAWLNTHLPRASSHANIHIITGYGDSMADTYKDGDILFVDVGYTEIRLDAVYVFELNREIFIKRLQRHPDGTLTAHSDNKRYDPMRIDNREEMRVIGRVVGALNWARL